MPAAQLFSSTESGQRYSNGLTSCAAKPSNRRSVGQVGVTSLGRGRDLALDGAEREHLCLFVLHHRVLMQDVDQLVVRVDVEQDCVAFAADDCVDLGASLAEIRPVLHTLWQPAIPRVGKRLLRVRNDEEASHLSPPSDMAVTLEGGDLIVNLGEREDLVVLVKRHRVAIKEVDDVGVVEGVDKDRVALPAGGREDACAPRVVLRNEV